MTKRAAISGLALGAITLTCSIPANAANMAFLRNSILNDMTKTELESFRLSARKALDSATDKETHYWKSDESSIRGKFQVQFSYQSEDAECRRMRFAFKKEASVQSRSHKERLEPFKFDLCKSGADWRIVDTPATQFTRADWDTLRSELHFALDNVTDGHPVSWVQPKSGVSGVIVPLTTEGKEKRCRKTALSIIDRKGRSSDGVYRFCREENTPWSREITTE